MKYNKDYTQLVSEYLCDELNKDKLKWFDNELAMGNDELMKELKLQKYILRSIKKIIVLDIKKFR